MSRNPCRKFRHRIQLRRGLTPCNSFSHNPLFSLSETPLHRPLRGSPSCPPCSPQCRSGSCFPRSSDRCGRNGSLRCSPGCPQGCGPRRSARCPALCSRRRSGSCGLDRRPRCSLRSSDRCSHDCPENRFPNYSRSCSVRCLIRCPTRTRGRAARAGSSSACSVRGSRRGTLETSWADPAA